MKISKATAVIIICGYAVCILGVIAIVLITRVWAVTDTQTGLSPGTETTAHEESGEEGEETNSGDSDPGAESFDTTPPVISGVSPIEVHVGEAVSYRDNITVTDDTDPDPLLTVDNSEVDLNSVGEYYVIYVAEDSSGNTSYAATAVKVMGSDTVTKDEAESLAEEILAGIVTDDMTDEEKLTAVYNYIYDIGYVDIDYADAEDYHTNGYFFLKTRRGNCRCFYGASRMLLESLGYECIMIKNDETAFTRHYWNLVSIDGGETYYHFDPTCWEWGRNADILMVCDDWLKAYAESPMNTVRIHIWDYDAYPATPETNLIENSWGDFN